MILYLAIGTIHTGIVVAEKLADVLVVPEIKEVYMIGYALPTTPPGVLLACDNEDLTLTRWKPIGEQVYPE